jgi:hypothetical protein
VAEKPWRQLFWEALHTRGGAPWKSLLELLGTNPVHEVKDEPSSAAFDPEGCTRREIFQLIVGSAALRGLTGCRRAPPQKMVPYTNQPNGVAPSQRTYYATSLCLDGYAVGVVVETHEGRPTKVEGNPIHPFSLDAAGILEQVSVLSLYDPNRAHAVRVRGRLGNFDELIAQLASKREDRGARLRLLIAPTVLLCLRPSSIGSPTAIQR